MQLMGGDGMKEIHKGYSCCPPFLAARLPPLFTDSMGPFWLVAILGCLNLIRLNPGPTWTCLNQCVFCQIWCTALKNCFAKMGVLGKFRLKCWWILTRTCCRPELKRETERNQNWQSHPSWPHIQSLYPDEILYIISIGQLVPQGSFGREEGYKFNY